MISPYRTVLIRASDGAAEAAADGWDVGPRAERARDRSFYPASGSGANGVAVGAHRGDCGGTETAGRVEHDQAGKGVLE